MTWQCKKVLKNKNRKKCGKSRAPEPETALGGSGVQRKLPVKIALIRSPSRVERREGNYEFGEYKANIYESKDTYERSKIRYRHEDEKWRVRQL